MSQVRILFLLLLTLGLTGCGSRDTETPAEAIQVLIGLYEARDFDTLVRTRYAEIDKAENDDQVRSLVERFILRFESQAALDEATAIYRAALAAEPTLSENGNEATFNVEGRFIRLSRMPDGRWGFHL